MKMLPRLFLGIRVVLVFSLALLLFFPKIFLNNYTFISTGMFYSDLYLFNYPVKDLFHRSLVSGLGIPFWTDLIGNGYPIFAESQMGGVNLLHLFFFSLPFKGIVVFNYDHLIHYFLGSVFCYLYARKSVRLRVLSSIFSSIVFTFCGFMLSYLQHPNVVSAVVYFPLNLYLADRILEIRWDQVSSRVMLFSRYLLWY